MIAAIGIIVVFAGVVGGYLLERGNLHILFQPAELLIIGGAALGSFLISSPQKIAIFTAKNLSSVFKGSGTHKAFYMELLMLLFELFRTVQREGMVSIESHVNRPEESAIFSKYKNITSNKEILEFICDNLKLFSASGMDPHDLETLMEIDSESRFHESLMWPSNVSKVADSLPGLGIVAAVLGVVITMGKMNEPPEVLGHSVGAALVGTFLGVLACYGFVAPMATNLEHRAKEKQTLTHVIKTALFACTSGSAPAIAVESGRRAVPPKDRPTFDELEEAMRSERKQGSS
jgi:chemotaxis protein MotA